MDQIWSEISNDETNFPHKLLLTDTQVSSVSTAFPNGSSANIKFSKGGWLIDLIEEAFKI